MWWCNPCCVAKTVADEVDFSDVLDARLVEQRAATPQKAEAEYSFMSTDEASTCVGDLDSEDQATVHIEKKNSFYSEEATQSTICSTEFDGDVVRPDDIECSCSADGGSSCDSDECVADSRTRSSAAMVRNVSHRIMRRMSRRQSTLLTASRRVPAPKVEAGAKPLYTEVLRNTTTHLVQAALKNGTYCPMLRFLKEVLQCHSILATGWKKCPNMPGTWVRKAQWSAPIPADIPTTVARLLGVPDVVTGTSVWRLQECGNTLTLMQHSYTKDVLYGERFVLQSTLQFTQKGNDVIFRNFADTKWVVPLPWTHIAVKAFVERKARVDALAMAPDLRRIIEDAMTAVVCSDNDPDSDLAFDDGDSDY